MREYELKPIYSSQKSFYKKAYVRDIGIGKYELRSYNTIVSQCIDGVVTHFGKYSRTTSRHQKEFELQYGNEREI